MEREIRIHIALNHDNIIKLYAAFEDEKNVYLVQELADLDLYERLNNNGNIVQEKYAVRDVISPCLNTLSYLHNLSIIHRDIKPENFLLASNENSKKTIKLADFGVSIDCSSERPVTRCGTLDYISPEALACPDKTHPEENKDLIGLVYGPSVDVWAVGVLAYELIVGLPPFEKDSRRETRDAILYDEPEFPSTISSQAKSFILAALSKSAATRVTVIDLLDHPWIQKYARVKSNLYERIGEGLPLASELSQALKLPIKTTLSQSDGGLGKEAVTPRPGSQINPSLPTSTSKSFSGSQGIRPPKPRSTPSRSPSLLPLISPFATAALMPTLKKTCSQIDVQSPSPTSPGLSPSLTSVFSEDLSPGLRPPLTPRTPQFSRASSRGSFVYPKHVLSSSKSLMGRSIAGHASTCDLALLRTESSASSLGSPLMSPSSSSLYRNDSLSLLNCAIQSRAHWSRAARPGQLPTALTGDSPIGLKVLETASFSTSDLPSPNDGRSLAAEHKSRKHKS